MRSVPPQVGSSKAEFSELALRCPCALGGSFPSALWGPLLIRASNTPTATVAYRARATDPKLLLIDQIDHGFALDGGR
jgi:hypothetical protein